MLQKRSGLASSGLATGMKLGQVGSQCHRTLTLDIPTEKLPEVKIQEFACMGRFENMTTLPSGLIGCKRLC